MFPTTYGTSQDDANVRRDFRRIIAAAGLVATEWTPRELQHSFVSLLSDDGMPLENISRLVGHSGASVTELVYRKQIRPVVEDGAVTMDRLFPMEDQEARKSTVDLLITSPTVEILEVRPGSFRTSFVSGTDLFVPDARKA